MPYDKITPDTLKKIREVLPYGAYDTLIADTNFSKAYITRFFDGDYKITENNYSIIASVRKIFRQQKSEVANIENQLKHK